MYRDRLLLLRGKIDGMKYIKESLCSCEIKPTGQRWIEQQIKDMEKRLKILTDECTN